MLTYRVPVVNKGVAVLQCTHGKGAGAYTGGLPSDAEHQVHLNAPSTCGARTEACSVGMPGDAQLSE